MDFNSEKENSNCLDEKKNFTSSTSYKITYSCNHNKNLINEIEQFNKMNEHLIMNSKFNITPFGYGDTGLCVLKVKVDMLGNSNCKFPLL